ncbi:hypothetical protein BB559_001034 [Furculomyces boomerangus]|uniref:Cyanovirin-N domain-containing protein n=2 Tax=Harpellales TaxID=61421 RepID=A0A2T9YHK6_9FUNG|nr:hypothetical protein BB559_003972 [Furculomyces boomerangus]PVU99073.1 hypothetical protein BB559_001034 [Furculomyces boomerangus]PVZ99052.1 hypothetical protein BB558_004937 [Smittium angustum]
MKSFSLLLACSLSSVFAVEYFQVFSLRSCEGETGRLKPYPNGCDNLEGFKSGAFGNSGKIKLYTESGCSGESFEVDLSKITRSCIGTDIDQTYKSVFYTP